MKIFLKSLVLASLSTLFSCSDGRGEAQLAGEAQLEVAVKLSGLPFASLSSLTDQSDQCLSLS